MPSIGTCFGIQTRCSPLVAQLSFKTLDAHRHVAHRSWSVREENGMTSALVFQVAVLVSEAFGLQSPHCYIGKST